MSEKIQAKIYAAIVLVVCFDRWFFIDNFLCSYQWGRGKSKTSERVRKSENAANTEEVPAADGGSGFLHRTLLLDKRFSEKQKYEQLRGKTKAIREYFKHA